jgi:hypothetical protein
MPPSVGAVALWCRPGTNQNTNAPRRLDWSRCSHRRMIQVMLEVGWCVCWWYTVYIIYIYIIYISISIYLSIFIQVYTCVDGICWVLMCSICWYLRDDLMNWRSQRLSKWRDDQLLPHERHFFTPIALCLFDIANLKITMFKSKLSEIINKYRIFHSY